MKRLCLTAFIFIMVCCTAPVQIVFAAYYTDFYDAHGQYISLGDCVTWVFDITDEGFNPDIEGIESAEVTLNLRDDGDLFLEFARLDIEGNQHTWEVDSGDINFQVQALSGLSEEGKMEITLTAVNSFPFGLFTDFYFNSATLNAHSNGAVPIPEPSNTILLAVGFISFFATMKFKKSPSTKSYSP